MAKRKEPEDRLVAVRLSALERAAIDKAVSTGVVANSSEAIRVAIRYLPRALADKFLEEDMPRLNAKIQELEQAMTVIDEPISRLPKDKLVAYAASANTTLKASATAELLRRGFFPDGLGSWVENRPDTTIPGRTGGRVGSPRGPR